MISFDSYKALTDAWKNYSTEWLENMRRELESYYPVIHERQAIQQQKDTEHFNIFSVISDKYKYENYHSDILKFILDPNTKEMGNPDYLRQFLRFIDLSEAKISEYFPSLESVEVLREKDRIDILIQNSTHAIIIENKINDAPDQANQLARYYKKVEESGRTVVKVIYLTLVERHPDFCYIRQDDFPEETFQTYKEHVQEKLRCLAAVSDKKADEGKTLKDFLERCAQSATSDLAKVVISQYAKLLEKAEGDIRMLEPEKKLITEIYSSKERIRDAEDFAEVWEKREDILREIYAERFHEKFTTDWYEEDEEFYKDIVDHRLSLCYDVWNGIGFWCRSKRSMQHDDIEKLKDILRKLSSNGLGTDGEPTHWIHDYSDPKDSHAMVYFTVETLDDFDKLMGVLDELIEKAKELTDF